MNHNILCHTNTTVQLDDNLSVTIVLGFPAFSYPNTSSFVSALHRWCNNGTGTWVKILESWSDPCDSHGSLRGAGTCHITMLIKCLSLCTLKSSLHMSETSDSSGSGSFKASFVIVTKLALERVSMAECIMGSHTSSMFGITNIFCGRTSTVTSKFLLISTIKWKYT